jgi:hypothetical protein
MADDAYTVSECRELLATKEGLCELEAAVAVACGYLCETLKRFDRDGLAVREWIRDEEVWTELPPPYLTTTPGDVGYGDRCLEMWTVLEANYGPLRSIMLERRPRGPAGRLRDVYQVLATPMTEAEAHRDVAASTIADALCLALAVAGLLPKKGGE